MVLVNVTVIVFVRESRTGELDDKIVEPFLRANAFFDIPAESRCRTQNKPDNPGNRKEETDSDTRVSGNASHD